MIGLGEWRWSWSVKAVTSTLKREAWQGGLFDSSSPNHAVLPDQPDISRVFERQPAVYRSWPRDDLHLTRESHTTHTQHIHRYTPPLPRPGSIDELRSYIKSIVDQIQLPHVLFVLLVGNVVLVMLPDETKERLQVNVRRMVYGRADQKGSEGAVTAKLGERDSAAAPLGAKDVKANKTVDERQIRKVKERAAAENASKSAETPEERAKRKAQELEKAAEGAAASANKPSKPMETSEERAKRKEKERATAKLRPAAGADDAASVKRQAETAEESAKCKAAQAAKVPDDAPTPKAAEKVTVPVKRKDETAEERAIRKTAEKAAVAKSERERRTERAVW